MTRKSVLLAALLLLVAAGVVAAALAVPWFFSLTYWQEGGVGTSRSEVIRNLGLAFIALGALIVGSMRAWSAHRQANVAEQGQITERFSRAAEQLGHDRVAVRIGGLYALKRIAEDSVERDHLAVMDVITSFIRHPPYTKEQRQAAEREKTLRALRANSAKENAEADPNDRRDQTAGGAAPPPKPELIDCPDIAAAIEIIQGRSEDQKAVEGSQGYRLSLSRARLSYLRLPEVDLQHFNLAGANLNGIELRGAGLTDAYLVRADLTGADLTGAGLADAYLMRADLTGANLRGANLTDANLTDANLTDANLTRADLTDATHLTQEQLDFACVSAGGKPPTLREGLKPPQKVCGP